MALPGAECMLKNTLRSRVDTHDVGSAPRHNVVFGEKVTVALYTAGGLCVVTEANNGRAQDNAETRSRRLAATMLSHK